MNCFCVCLFVIDSIIMRSKQEFVIRKSTLSLYDYILNTIRKLEYHAIYFHLYHETMNYFCAYHYCLLEDVHMFTMKNSL